MTLTIFYHLSCKLSQITSNMKHDGSGAYVSCIQAHKHELLIQMLECRFFVVGRL